MIKPDHLPASAAFNAPTSNLNAEARARPDTPVNLSELPVIQGRLRRNQRVSTPAVQAEAYSPKTDALAQTRREIIPSQNSYASITAQLPAVNAPPEPFAKRIQQGALLAAPRDVNLERECFNGSVRGSISRFLPRKEGENRNSHRTPQQYLEGVDDEEHIGFQLDTPPP